MTGRELKGFFDTILLPLSFEEKLKCMEPVINIMIVACKIRDGYLMTRLDSDTTEMILNNVKTMSKIERYRDLNFYRHKLTNDNGEKYVRIFFYNRKKLSRPKHYADDPRYSHDIPVDCNCSDPDYGHSYQIIDIHIPNDLMKLPYNNSTHCVVEIVRLSISNYECKEVNDYDIFMQRLSTMLEPISDRFIVNMRYYLPLF